MKLRLITFTGADDETSQKEMSRISQEFNAVEWGILFGSEFGRFRYPNLEWILNLPHGLNLSAHFCGKFAEMAMEGNLPLFSLENFKRIQLNLSNKALVKTLECQPLIELSERIPQDVILGGNFGNVKIQSNNFSILYDASGGNGISPKNWPVPETGMFVGFAGGLNPENLLEELERISEVAGDRQIWIDMESGVRSNNQFDLDKVERCLKIAKPWMAS